MKSIKQVQQEDTIVKCNGEVYFTKVFNEYVARGSFTPCDGIGYFHDGEKETNRSVWTSGISSADIEKYPYVCWYNK